MAKEKAGAFDRREFLKIGASVSTLTASVGVAFSDARRPAANSIAAVTAGYWWGSEGLASAGLDQRGEFLLLANETDCQPESTFRLIDASAMISGDPELRRRQALVSVAGAYFPPAEAEDEPRGIDLVVLFDSGGVEPWEFLCWRAETGPRGQWSSPIQFGVPPASKGFNFRLETFNRTHGAWASNLALTPGLSWLGPKLRRGVYLLAGPRESNHLPPRWSDCRLREVPGDGSRRRFRLETRTGATVDFAYLTLVVQ